MTRQRGSIMAFAALAAGLAAAASGCGQYEAAPTDLTAMPKRPEASPPAENGVGIIAGEVRVETLAASQPVTFQTVVLSQNGKVLGTSTTDAHGRFRFDKGEADLYEDGLYELTLVSDRYRGVLRIQYARLGRRSYTLSATPREGP